MAQLKLTEAIVKSLQVDPSKDLVFHDTEQSGLVCIVRKGGSKVYCYRVQVPGPKRKYINKRIDDADKISLAAARKIARNWSNQLAMGEDPFAKKKASGSKTFSSVYDAWLGWSKDHPTNPRAHGVRKSMSENRTPLSYFDGFPLDQINKSTVEDYRALQAKAGKKNATVNRYITDLKFLAKWAVDHGMIADHKLHDVKRVAELDSVPKTHHFTPEERDAFLKVVMEACTKVSGGRRMAYLYPLAFLLMHTGIRKQSALGMIWNDIDFAQKRMKLRAANIKTRKDAILPLSDSTLEVLKNWKEQTTGIGTDHLFPGDGSRLKDVKKQFKRLFAVAGLDKKYSVNSLRHDFASELVDSDANITTIQMLLVHKDPKTTMKYAHPSETHMRETVNKLG